MATLSRKPASGFTDAEVVVCVVPHYRQDGAMQIGYLDRLRADHAAVRAHPEFFLPDGCDKLEISRRLAELAVADAPPPPAPLENPTVILKRLADKDAVVCIVGSRSGQRFARNSAEVKARPDAFVPVIPEPGLERRDALVATTTLTEILEDGTRRSLYQGQWARRDNPWVLAHPTHFEMPAIEED
jgi:hypothetical protein